MREKGGCLKALKVTFLLKSAYHPPPTSFRILSFQRALVVASTTCVVNMALSTSDTVAATPGVPEGRVAEEDNDTDIRQANSPRPESAASGSSVVFVHSPHHTTPDPASSAEDDDDFDWEADSSPRPSTQMRTPQPPQTSPAPKV